MADDDDDELLCLMLLMLLMVVLSVAVAATRTSSSLGDLERRRINGNGSCACAETTAMFGPPVVAITVEGMSSISSREDVCPSSEQRCSRSGDIGVLCRWVISVRPLTCKLFAVFKNVGNWQ